MSEVSIRRAVPSDAARIAEIYNHYVLNTTVTFDAEPKTVEERLRWLHAHDDSHPVLIGEHDGETIAWGSLTKWGTRAAYQHSVEVSVYVDKTARGRGIGKAMTSALIDEAVRVGHHALITQIVSENAPSLHLSEDLGFERIGVLREVGWKFGAWLDVVITELLLPEHRSSESSGSGAL
jgi:L-amino acid N-acyltransferase YncA